MTFLQKTSAVFVGVVFCFFVLQPTYSVGGCNACACNLVVEGGGVATENEVKTFCEIKIEILGKPNSEGDLQLCDSGRRSFELGGSLNFADAPLAFNSEECPSMTPDERPTSLVFSSEGITPTTCEEIEYVYGIRPDSSVAGKDYIVSISSLNSRSETVRDGLGFRPTCQFTDSGVYRFPLNLSQTFRTFVSSLPESQWNSGSNSFIDCPKIPSNFLTPDAGRTRFSAGSASGLFTETSATIKNATQVDVDAANECPSLVVGVDDNSGYYVVSLTSCSPVPNSAVCGSESEIAGSGYESIAFGFPTADIERLNKTGITGTGTTQVQLLIGRLIKYAVGFLGTLALCLVIYSGLKFMLSEGDADKQKEALNMMLWAGIGIVALLGSYSVVLFVLGILR